MEQTTLMYLDSTFYGEVKEVLTTARRKAFQAVNFAMVEAYWQIGKSIVEKQGGDERSAYGKGLLKELSEQLTKDFGKGFTERNWRVMRQFYLSFQNWHAVRAELSWTHYRLIIKVNNEQARQFYMNECAKYNWSTRELEGQINSHFYERLLINQGEEAISSDLNELVSIPHKPEEMIRDPYVLEFLGLRQDSSFYENELEKSLITHIEAFLLELGRGFAFVARQKRITLDGQHFYIDLVCYNYILKCFVLIDLKTGVLTHQDIGQMQMYVNYYTRELMNEGDSKPIGIVLCASKNDSVVKYTLPEDNQQIFASAYQMYLPSVVELQNELTALCQVLMNSNEIDI